MTRLYLLPIHDLQSLHKTAQRPHRVNHFLTIFLVPDDEHTAPPPPTSAWPQCYPWPRAPPWQRVSSEDMQGVQRYTAAPCTHPTSAETPPLAESEARGDRNSSSASSFSTGILSRQPSQPYPIPLPGRAVAARNHEAGRARDSSEWAHSHVLCRAPGTELCAEKRERRATTVGAWNMAGVKLPLMFIKCPLHHSQSLPMWVHLFMTLEPLAAEFTNSALSFHYTPRTTTLNWILDVPVPQLNKWDATPPSYAPPGRCLASWACLRVEIYLENSVI